MVAKEKKRKKTYTSQMKKNKKCTNLLMKLHYACEKITFSTIM